jgi:exodeoxyribonuclease V alpha subunit
MDELIFNGIVEHIAHYNEADGYCVAIVKEEEENSSIKVVGVLPQIKVGETMRFRGSLTTHPSFGLQFNVSAFEQVVPKTLDGIANYLASGFIRGVGPVIANLIVQAFGLETINVIEQEPEKLLKIKGISENKLEKIIIDWKSHKAIQETMIFLQGLGASPNLAYKIHRKYGDSSIELVQENPYRLADDIWGIGFRTADTIARAMGVPLDSQERIEAATKYILSQESSNGHVYTPQRELIRKVSEMIEIHPAKAEYAVKMLLLRADCMGDPMVVNGVEDYGIYLTELFYAEIGITNEIKRLIKQEKSACLSKLNQHDKDLLFLTAGGEKLTETQRSAVDLALRSKVSVLTGGPGTGKSLTTSVLVNICKQNHIKIELASPTGRAAKRLAEVTNSEARTIHRLLEYNPAEGKFEVDEDNQLDADIVVIDEASMLDTQIAYALFRSIKADAHIMLIGDPDQLPSVGPGDVLRDIIKSGVIPVTRLTQIFRQGNNSMIISNAHRINSGKSPVTENNMSGDFFFFNIEDPEKAVENIVDLATKRIPEKFGFDPTTDIQVLSPMRKGPLGILELNRRLRDTINPHREGVVEKRIGDRVLRLGDKVMQLRNSYDKGVFNGDIGVISDIDNVEGTITVDFDSAKPSYDYTELDQLTHAYCISIHKSQGSEHPVSLTVIHNSHYVMLQRNLLYTAITRAKKLVVLVGTQKAINMAVRNSTVADRHTGLAVRLRNM